jgi:hypothetical protein
MAVPKLSLEATRLRRDEAAGEWVTCFRTHASTGYRISDLDSQMWDDHHEAVSFLIADKEGRIARVAAAPEGMDVALAQDGMLAAINLIPSEGMQHLERIAEEGYVVYRYQERIAAWYDDHRGQIDLDTAKRLCSLHREPLTLLARLYYQIQGNLQARRWRWSSRTGPRSFWSLHCWLSYPVVLRNPHPVL